MIIKGKIVQLVEKEEQNYYAIHGWSEEKDLLNISVFKINNNFLPRASLIEKIKFYFFDLNQKYDYNNTPQQSILLFVNRPHNFKKGDEINISIELSKEGEIINV